MLDQPATHDLIIVGGGPAGLAAGLYAARMNLKTVLVDRGPLGGQLLNTELIEDYLGFESIAGAELAAKMAGHAHRFGLEVHEFRPVSGIDVEGGIKVARMEDGGELRAPALILATGGLPRRLGVPGEVELAGRGVSYCAICDGAFFKNQVLAVVGGGDSAVEEATFLTRYGEKVYIIHRRDEWRAQKLLQDRALANPKIGPVWNSVVEEIGGDSKVEWLRVRDLQTGEESRLEVGGVFIYVGFMPNSQIFGPEFKKDDQGFIITDDKMETHVPGIYVAGDVRSQYVRQISNAVGDATTAAVAATRYIEELDATSDSEQAESGERIAISY